MSGGEPEVPRPEKSGWDMASCDQAIPRLSPLYGTVFLFTGVVLPVICFALSCPVRPQWQSGSIESYAQLLLSWNWAVLHALRTLLRKSEKEGLWGVARTLGVVTLLSAVIVPLLLLPTLVVLIVLFLPLTLGLCLLCSTPWAVATYVAMTVYVARHSGVERLRFSLAQLFGLLA